MSALPSSGDFTGTSKNQGEFKAAVTALIAWATGLFGTNGTAATARATLGSTTVGDALFTAASEAAARSTIGAENTANKATDFSTVNHTLFPSVQAVKAYADGLVVGLLDDRGSFDASGNVWPSSGGSGTAGAIMKGDIWYISVAGTLGGTAVAVNDAIRALTDTPGTTASNWDIMLSPASVATQIHAVTSKATPVDADELGLVDSATSNVLKKLTWANLVAAIAAYTTTLTNKRVTLRDGTSASTTSANTLTINSDSYDQWRVTGLTEAITTLTITGTPTEGQGLIIDFTDNGTARALTLTASAEPSGTLTLPTTTVISTKLSCGFKWNSASSKWRLMGKS